MTGELEQQFFSVFGIEKKCNRETLKFCVGDLDCNTCKSPFYPKITAEKLLEMICILNNYGKYDCWGVTVARLKDAVLENCIAVVVLKLLNDTILEQFKHKIQQLFEVEGKNKLCANKDYG